MSKTNRRIENLKQNTEDINEIQRIYVMGWNDALEAVLTLLKGEDNDRKEVPQPGEVLPGDDRSA